MSVGKDMYFMRRSKVMDFECGLASLEADKNQYSSRASALRSSERSKLIFNIDTLSGKLI